MAKNPLPKNLRQKKNNSKTMLLKIPQNQKHLFFPRNPHKNMSFFDWHRRVCRCSERWQFPLRDLFGESGGREIFLLLLGLVAWVHTFALEMVHFPPSFFLLFFSFFGFVNTHFYSFFFLFFKIHLPIFGFFKTPLPIIYPKRTYSQLASSPAPGGAGEDAGEPSRASGVRGRAGLWVGLGGLWRVVVWGFGLMSFFVCFGVGKTEFLFVFYFIWIFFFMLIFMFIFFGCFFVL